MDFSLTVRYNMVHTSQVKGGTNRMKKPFTVVVTLLLMLSLLAGPIAQVYNGDIPPVPPVTESEPDSDVMPAKYPTEIENENV